jgi:hypothetical protein
MAVEHGQCLTLTGFRFLFMWVGGVGVGYETACSAVQEGG